MSVDKWLKWIGILDASAFNPLESSGGATVFEESARSRVRIPQRVNAMTPSREERCCIAGGCWLGPGLLQTILLQERDYQEMAGCLELVAWANSDAGNGFHLPLYLGRAANSYRDAPCLYPHSSPVLWSGILSPA